MSSLDGPERTLAVRRARREARRSRRTVRETVGRLEELVGRSVDLDARLDEAAGSRKSSPVRLFRSTPAPHTYIPDPPPPDGRRVLRDGTAEALDPASTIPDSVFKERHSRKGRFGEAFIPIRKESIP